MIGEDFEHKPLANLIRGITEDEPGLTADKLAAILRERGLDSNEVASEIESRVSAHLQRQRPRQTVRAARKWNNPSVQDFAEGRDAIEKMVSLARNFALELLEGSNRVGPVDPFRLAELRRIPVIPNEAIADARLVPLPADRMQIEFNPNQPKSRTRFSIAHELAHTFFDNCRDAIRNRKSHHDFDPHEWELEMLCNIGAAELLMPVASLPELRSEALNIATLMQLKERLEVSAEALLARVSRITTEPCAMFAASRIEEGNMVGRYRIDYAILSRSWQSTDPSGGLLPTRTVVTDCTAIGFTAIGDETWSGIGPVHVEAVGVWPYRGARFPRVLGIVTSGSKTSEAGVRIVGVKGDATEPRGSGPRILAHNINDKAISWGFGFAGAIARKWPKAEAAFRARVFKDKSTLRLGNTFNTEVEHELWTFQMVCQHGYGPPSTTRMRYSALKTCLDELVRFALERKATVHMPRLGTGYGGANWDVVAEIVDETICGAGIPVTVYESPNAKLQQPVEQPELFSREPKGH